MTESKTEQQTREMEEIRTILIYAGDAYHGGRAGDLSREWLDCGFSPSEVDEWIKIGCWDPDTASEWDGLDLTPDDVARAAEQLNRDEKAKGCDAIYAACNGDLDPAVFAPRGVRDELAAEIAAAFADADICCPDQVCDEILAVAERGGDWRAELARAVANDAAERRALDID